MNEDSGWTYPDLVLRCNVRDALYLSTGNRYKSDGRRLREKQLANMS